MDEWQRAPLRPQLFSLPPSILLTQIAIMPGRGGAGNILAVQQEKQRVAEDLESNQQVADQTSNPSSADLPLRQDQQYAHSGRGGAGNYYSPRELEETGSFNDTLPTGLGAASNASASTAAGSSVPAGQNGNAASEPVRRYGRGGAGNMSFGVTEDEARVYRKRREEEEQRQEKLKADVEANVNAILMEPPRARLPAVKPYAES